MAKIYKSMSISIKYDNESYHTILNNLFLKYIFGQYGTAGSMVQCMQVLFQSNFAAIF